MRELLYVADPMCSWCYGFAPTWREIRARLAPDVRLRLVLGGLAPDSDEPMPAELARYVQAAWHTVERRTGQPFDHAFWERNVPRRSTWIACRACLAAEDLRESAAAAMFEAVQEAYYRRARNPSDEAVLADLAEELGLERASFVERLRSAGLEERLQRDFATRDAVGASGFPSLGLREGERLELLQAGWAPPEATLALLSGRGLLASTGAEGRTSLF